MDNKSEVQEQILTLPIDSLRLSREILTMLRGARIVTVGDLVRMEREQGLLRVRNLGRTHYQQIETALAELGLMLDGSPVERKAPEKPPQPAPVNSQGPPGLKTAVFVDYEHWYVALRELHHRKPNIKLWFDDLKKRGKLLEVTFFGDFSDAGGMRDELEKIRCFTNRINETKNPSLYSKKSFTDFIMLDNIYQKVISSPELEQIILFTGDGDFCSAAAYLRNFCGKRLGIYGVDNAFSVQLEEISDWCVRIPFISEPRWECRVAILKNIQYALEHAKSPTFRPTVRLVAEHYGLPEDAVEAELRLLLNEGVRYTMPERNRRDYTMMMNVLHINQSIAGAAEQGIGK